MKKLIAMLLSVIIAFSVFAVPVSAQQTVTQDLATQSQTTQTESEIDEAFETVDNVLTNVQLILEMVVEIIKTVHELVGTFLSMFGEVCPMCGKLHVFENADLEKRVNIDESIFIYNENNGKYNIFEEIESIEGFLLDSSNAESLSFYVVDVNGNEIDSGDINIAKNWSTKDIDFFIGENILTVEVLYSDGTFATDRISVNCFVDSYMDDVAIDTSSDSDGDQVVDYLEINYTHTDINKTDTDGDGLNDYYETVIIKYNPLKKDSDNNGINDGYEDFDSDGLNNLFEIENGLDPAYEDSDFDDLTDGEELNNYRTDPLNKDTDGDGVNDGIEVEAKMDPLKFETVFNVTESFGKDLEDSMVSLTVSTALNPEQVGTLNISPVSVADNGNFSPMIPGYIDEGFDITVEGNVTNATLTFTFDESLGAPNEKFQPRIYYFNEQEHTFEELPNQTVSNGKVSATVSHFSMYILLNKVEFDKVWNDEIKPPEYEGEGKNGIDVVFVIDSSGSMSSNDGKNIRLAAAKEFVQKLGENDRAAVIDFDDNASLYQNFTSDKTALETAINRINRSGGTNLSKGMNLAISQFTNSDYTRTDAYKYIVFLTDGDGSYSTSYTNTAKNNDIIVYTIGLGSGVRESLLKTIAETTGGKYYFASTAERLPDIYSDVSKETIDYTTDSNNDGISDYYTQLLYDGTLALSNGSTEFRGVNLNYDSNGELCADIDGDGLKNGQELIVCETSNGVCVVKYSDPLMEYSDCDILPDKTEYDNDSDPLVPSYPAGHIEYALDDSNFTYVDVLNNEDKWYNAGARNMWSTITFNWSHEDEALRLIAGFAQNYANIEDITGLAESVKKEFALQIGHQTIQSIMGTLGDVNDDAGKLQQVGETVIGIKQWISAGNRTNINASWFSTLKAQVGQFNYLGKTKFYTKVGNIGKYATAGLTLVEEGLDIYEICDTYSLMCATADSFIKLEDMLTYIKNNDEQKEKYVGKAAAEALAIVKDEYKSFKTGGAWEEIATATVENAAKMGVALLSANPFVAAVNLLIFVIDNALPITQIGEGVYSLYVIDEISNACKALFECETYSDLYYNIDNSKIVYIYWLIYARRQGGEFAKEITSKQHYIGFFNDEKERKKYRDAINFENSRLEKAYEQIQLAN